MKNNTNIKFGVFLAPGRHYKKFRELKKMGADFSYIDPFDVKEFCNADYMNYFEICDKVGVDGVVMLHNFQNDSMSKVENYFNLTKKTDFSVYKNIPAVSLWDEPLFKSIDLIGEQLSWADEKFLDKYVNVNLFPEYVDKNFLGSSYEDYVEEYCKKVIAKQKSKSKLSTDIYPLLVQNGKFKLEPTYLHNLDLFAKKTTEYKTEMEIFIQTTDFMGHKSPTAEDMSAQILIAFAFGTRFVTFFTYRTIEQNDDCCENQMGIILPGGSRSPRYNQLKKIIKKCKKLDGIYSGYTYKGAYATSNCNEESIVKLDKIDKIPFANKFTSDKNALITVNEKDGKTILTLVNYNFDDASDLSFEFDFEVDNYICLNSDGKKFKPLKRLKNSLPFGKAMYFIF